MLEELKEAREWVHRGWTQGAYWKDALGVELNPMEALHNQIPQVQVMLCGRSSPPSKPRRNHLLRANGSVGRTTRSPNGRSGRAWQLNGLIDWNDSPDRIKRDVMEAFNLGRGVCRGLGSAGGRRMTILQSLRDARSLVERGWTQHSYYRDAKGKTIHIPLEGGPHRVATCCALGAVNLASPTHLVGPVVHALHDQLCGGDLVEWNDTPHRTQAEVLKHLR